MSTGLLAIAAIAVLFAGYSAEGRFPKYGANSVLAFLLLAAFLSLISQVERLRPFANALAGLIALTSVIVAVPQLQTNVGRSDAPTPREREVS